MVQPAISKDREIKRIEEESVPFALNEILKDVRHKGRVIGE